MSETVKRKYSVTFRGDDEEIALVEEELQELLSRAEENGMTTTMRMVEEVPVEEEETENEEEEDGDAEEDE